MESSSKLEKVDIELSEIFESYTNTAVNSSSDDFNDWLSDRIAAVSKQIMPNR
jgi:hypothetical protein